MLMNKIGLVVDSVETKEPKTISANICSSHPILQHNLDSLDSLTRDLLYVGPAHSKDPVLKRIHK